MKDVIEQAGTGVKPQAFIREAIISNLLRGTVYLDLRIFVAFLRAANPWHKISIRSRSFYGSPSSSHQRYVV
jgi:hypothetical protein